MGPLAFPLQWLLGSLLLLSAIAVLVVRKPVHASLSFLATLLLLAVYYLQLSAQFIAVSQVLVYAGAILVIFMFVIILFQDAHQKIDLYPPNSSPFFLAAAGTLFLLALILFFKQFLPFDSVVTASPSPTFGSVESLGRTLYIDFVFPFEALMLLFLVAIVGAFYIARREE